MSADATKPGGHSRLIDLPDKTGFCGRVPEGLLYDTNWDMWVKRDGDEVVIGATAYGLFLTGEILAFTPKPSGAEAEAGRGIGTVESAKTVLAIHTPVSLKLRCGNEVAEGQPALINRDPYGEGWMLRGLPLDWERDARRLVDAAGYREHVRSGDPEARFLP
ncbi:MAG: hypothetical protein HYZ17_15500 [Betaproteobacteria bacterium]|nr:hypothetical protein [Betaproteobacteria bacterium]